MGGMRIPQTATAGQTSSVVDADSLIISNSVRFSRVIVVYEALANYDEVSGKIKVQLFNHIHQRLRGCSVDRT